MAIGIQNFPNINAPDSDYPNGRTRDRTLSQTGTPLNELTLGDMRQFFAKMMRQAAITPNGIPDNEYSGNQYFDALHISAVPYKKYSARIFQSSTTDPTGDIYDNTIGSIVWSRQGAGSYIGTLIGAFQSQTTWCIITGACQFGAIEIFRASINAVEINTYTFAGAPSDDVLSGQTLEIRIYNSPGTSF